MSKVLELTKENIQEVIDNNENVVIDFWAAWCGPCRAIAPAYEQIAESFIDKAILAKVNADQNKEVLETFQIRSLPTFLFFKNGKLLGAMRGAVPKTHLEERIKALVEQQ